MAERDKTPRRISSKGKPAPSGPKRAGSKPAAGSALLARLAERTGLSEAEVLERALSAYAAAVAPGLADEVAPKGLTKTIGRAAQKPVGRAPRLWLSLDGGPEREVRPPEAIIGREPGCDIRADLPLIGGRHARLALRDGRWLFEDLGSLRGSYKGGERLQVSFLASGDEIDLGGFLPARFRVQA